MGRRGSVEVPRGRVGRPVGRRQRSAPSRRSRTRTRGTGPTGSRSCVRGSRQQEVVQRLTEADEGREHRQLGVVDAQGGAATYTGGECQDWAGGRTGDGYAAQGNILVSAETVDALAETFEAARGKPLAERLLDCLDAAQAAGGDRRGQQSAALLVVEKDGGYAGLSDVARRPARGRPRASARGDSPYLRAARRALRPNAEGQVGRRRRRVARRARRAPRRARLHGRARAGPGRVGQERRTTRCASTESSRSILSCSRR